MLIEFVPNPSFRPTAPAIRVGSVVQTIDGYKRFITSIGGSTHNQYNLWGHGWHSRDFFTVLPERVSGWDERGPQFAPLDPPPASFSWSDYPPKAGMVVEYDQSQYRVLLTDGEKMIAVNKDGEVRGSAMREGDSFVPEMKDHEYRPRPDLMPRFVTEGRR